MEIKVIGRWIGDRAVDCLACRTLRVRLAEAIKELGLTHLEIKSCQSKEEYDSYGVILTPLLVINGKIKIMGKVPTKNRLIEIIKADLDRR